MSQQEHRTRRSRSIAAYIVAATCALYILATCVIAVISYGMYKDAFTSYSSDLCLGNNALAAFIIDGDQVERFRDSLTIDAEYEAFSDMLDRLRQHLNATYFYILTDTGVPDMFTYIYDATHAEDHPGVHFALGEVESKDEYEGADAVLQTGEGFTEALYYNDYYGELYYAYSPIFNSAGEVVAFVGTDIDTATLKEQLGSYRTVITVVVMGASALFALVCWFILRRILTVPLRNITDNAARIAQGDLQLHISEKVTRRNDEIGRMAGEFRQMASSMVGLIADIERIMLAVRNGFLRARIDLQWYRGDYYRIVDGVNSTLEVVCQHFDAVPDAVGLFSLNQRVRYGNAAMKKFVTLHGFDLQKETFLPLVFSEGREPVLESGAAQVFRATGDTVFRKEIALPVGDDGQMMNYALTLLPIRSAEEQNTCVMLMLSDITTVTKAKDTAISASRAKGDFLSRMSHEIRTPLNAIIGLSEIAKDASDVEKIKSCLHKIESSSTHLLGIINDILDFSKIEAGKLQLDEALFSLAEDMEFILTMMTPRAKERNITLKFQHVGVTHDGIVSDSLRLNQVLINLLTNAVKFSYTGGTVDLIAEEIGHEDGVSTYRFTVRDQGIGMSEKQVGRLFQPFEQTDASIATQYGGTGLGLAISKNIVEMMGGTIVCQSELNKGSTFSFTISAHAEEKVLAASPAETQDTDSETVDFTGRRALIVDDIEINREILLELLDYTGLMMDTAVDGHQAVMQFTASAPGTYDVILMDMQMPVMDGCAATQAIRALNRPDAASVKIIAMTANVMQEDVQRALASGMNGHLGKPIDVHKLIRTLGETFAEGRG